MSRGRSYCNVVESYECEAPAGFRSGVGYASVPGVRRSDLHTCAYCGEPVCGPCSDVMMPPAFCRSQKPVRVCLSHEAEELVEVGYGPSDMTSDLGKREYARMLAWTKREAGSSSQSCWHGGR